MNKSIYISNDEWYPVWYLQTTNGTPAEVSLDEYFKIVKVFKDFEEVQKRLKELGTSR